MMKKKMLSSIVVAWILLLFSPSGSHGAVLEKPPLCDCHTNVSDPLGENHRCNTRGCSRGDNPSCSADNFSGKFPHHRVVDFYGVTPIGPYAYFLCSCPGFSFNHGRGGSNGYILCFSPGDENKVDNYGSNPFNYSSCSDFNQPSFDLADCCNFCCGT